MKKNFLWFIGIAVIANMAATGVFADGPKTSPTVVKNEIILPKSPESYMEARHIVLKGSNEEIGKALGDIAQNDYGTKLVKYADPVYAEARREYMKKNYPVMLERMKGVARSYGVNPGETDLDTSGLYYWLTSPECSAMFFPAGAAASGHNFYVANRDYYLASMSEIMDKPRKPGEKDFSAYVFVVELYPDKGYSSLGVGIIDLMSINIDAVNSAGLAVAVLADDTFGVDHTSHDFSRLSGLYIYQAVRMIVDTCATVEEAKIAILANEVTMMLLPAHFMVMDSSGRSFIYERSSKDFTDRFVDNPAGEPVPITNHSIYDYPSVDKFPAPEDNDYDTFNRYRRLAGFIDSHTDKYSEKDGQDAMALVYGRVEESSESGHHDIPLRTLYTAVVDIDEREMSVRFYLRDGEKDTKTGFPELIFSEPFEFKLKSDAAKIARPGKKK